MSATRSTTLFSRNHAVFVAGRCSSFPVVSGGSATKTVKGPGAYTQGGRDLPEYRVAPEAQLRATKNGLVPDGKGWFVVNARESRSRDGGPLGVYCTFEGRQRFPQLGITLNVLAPGQPLAIYHRENAQEGFLVVSGECVLIVEGEQRRLVAWDFFHCPSRTEHVIVGSGNAAAVVLAVGARGRGRGGGVVSRVCEAAAPVWGKRGA